MSRRAQSQSPEPEELGRAAAFRLALRRFHARSDEVVRRHALTPRQYLLLLALEATAARKGHVTVGDLVAMLVLAHGTLSELLDRAEAAGLVLRRTAVDDRRVVHVTATEEGRRRFVGAFRELAEQRQEVARAAHELLTTLEPPASSRA